MGHVAKIFVCLRNKNLHGFFVRLLCLYSNIILARGGDLRTQFTIMGGKLRSANHCIIGEMFVLKRLFFSSFSEAEQSTITITSED